jgi:hypothetical protein
MEEKDKVIEQPEKKKKKQNFLWLFIKKNKLKTLLFLFIALVANTYAWFLYNKIVSANLDAHIKSWQVTIDGANDDTLTFHIDDLYPGMDEYSDQVTLTNAGEMDADITFSIHSMRIFEDTYEVGVNGETAASLEAKLASYPFEITYEASSESISSHGGETDFRLYVNWDFGDGDEEKDALDTEYGEASYDYHAAHPSSPCIELVLDINVSQTQPGNNP